VLLPLAGSARLPFLTCVVSTPSSYASVFLAVSIAAFVFFTFIPRKDVEQNDQFVANLKEFRLWLPKIKFNALALNMDMFCVTIFGSVMMYVFTALKECPPKRWAPLFSTMCG